MECEKEEELKSNLEFEELVDPDRKSATKIQVAIIIS